MSSIVSDSLNPRYPGGYSGNLEKRGHWRKNWNERFFTLIPEERVLRYFTNSGQTHIKGDIQLNHDSMAEPYASNAEMEYHTHVFVVKARQNNEEVIHYISATNDKTMRRWIEAIQEVIHDGFPLISQPKIWNHAFYCSSHIACSFNHMNGSIVRIPLDSELKLSDVRKPPMIAFTKPYHEEPPHHKHHHQTTSACPITQHHHKQHLHVSSTTNDVRAYTIVMFDPDMPPAGYLCWLVMNVIDEDIYTGVDVVGYSSPAPVYGKRHQLYIIILQQTDVFSHTHLEACMQSFSHRYAFSLDKLLNSASYTSSSNPAGIKPHPVGVTRYLLPWEMNCDELHERMGYRPPKACLSSYQHFDLLKFCYHHYKLSNSLYFIDRQEYYVMNAWNTINISYRKAYNNNASISTSSSSFACHHRDNHQKTSSSHDKAGVNLGSANLTHVYNGDVLDFNIIRQEPYVSYTLTSSSESDNQVDYYMMVMLCLDYPSRTQPYHTSSSSSYVTGFIHWIVGNIPNNNFSAGEEIGPYVPLPRDIVDAKPIGDYHRHVTLLFKQEHRLTTSDIASRPFDRLALPLLPWLQSLVVGLAPVAFNMFISSTQPVASLYDDHDTSPPSPASSSSSSSDLVIMRQNQTRRILPKHITWQLPPHLPYNHPSNISSSTSNLVVIDSAPRKNTCPDLLLMNMMQDDDNDDDDDDDLSIVTPSSSITPVASILNDDDHLMTSSKMTYDAEVEKMNLFHGCDEEEQRYMMILLTGEVVRKKFSIDYVSKKRYVWIDAYRQTLNWCRAAADKHRDGKVKSIDIKTGNVRDVGIITQSLAVIIRMAFTSGSYIDVEVAAAKQDDVKRKRDAWLTLINRVRYHTFQHVSAFNTSAK